jgi:archaellum component FlaG (FlaF/FlaG flagellin family)
MYIYDNMVYNYVQMVSAYSTNLLPGIICHTLIKGDRITALTSNTATPTLTVLSVTVELTVKNEGSKTILVDAPEHRFITDGNPCHSQVDMNAVLTTNTTNISPNFCCTLYLILGTRGTYTVIVASTGVTSAFNSDAS